MRLRATADDVQAVLGTKSQRGCQAQARRRGLRAEGRAFAGAAEYGRGLAGASRAGRGVGERADDGSELGDVGWGAGLSREWTDHHGLHLVRRLLGYHECGAINGHQWVQDSERTFRLPDFPTDDSEMRKAAEAWCAAKPGSRAIQMRRDPHRGEYLVTLLDVCDLKYPITQAGRTLTEALAWALWRAER